MKNIIPILLIMICTSARADFILSTGLTTGNELKSEQKTDGERALNANSGGGVALGVEWNALPWLSFPVTGGFHLRSGQVQYRNDQSAVNNLDASVSQFYLDEGVRARFINMEKFHAYLGAGISLGWIGLVIDKDDFKKQNAGSTAGYEESEGKGQAGGYLEAGIEYLVTKVHGGRLFAKYAKTHTGEFDNLGDKALTLESVTFGAQYIYYLNL